MLTLFGRIMKRLKILWLSHLVPYPAKGGVLQRANNLLKELAKYNDKIWAESNTKDLPYWGELIQSHGSD